MSDGTAMISEKLLHEIAKISSYWFLHVVNVQEILMISWHDHVSYGIRGQLL